MILEITTFVVLFSLLGVAALMFIPEWQRPRRRYQGSKNLVFKKNQNGVWEDDPTRHWVS